MFKTKKLQNITRHIQSVCLHNSVIALFSTEIDYNPMIFER
jgi:hypothetical protein